MANRINLNGTSYHGAGAIAEIANEAKAHAFKKAFVCSDPDLIKFNVTSKVTDVLEKEGLEYEIYSDIKANPTIQNFHFREEMEPGPYMYVTWRKIPKEPSRMPECRQQV